MVSFLPHSDDGFEAAWKLLEEKYENQKLPIYTLVRRVLNCQMVTGPTGLEKFVDQVREVLRALELMNCSVKTADFLLLPILTDKLDAHSRQAWELEDSGSEVPTVAKLLLFLQERTQAATAVTVTSSTATGLQDPEGPEDGEEDPLLDTSSDNVRKGGGCFGQSLSRGWQSRRGRPPFRPTSPTASNSLTPEVEAQLPRLPEDRHDPRHGQRPRLLKRVAPHGA